MKNNSRLLQNVTIWLLIAVLTVPCPNDPHCLTCQKINSRHQCTSCQKSQLNRVTGECNEIPSRSFPKFPWVQVPIRV